MRRLYPPLHLLRAFATTARFGSVTRASEALHLTQSAVSKQVQELERWTGTVLFERVRKRLNLTPAGQRYEAAIRPLLAQLENATLELIACGEGGETLKVSTLPTFGAKWLIPRLPVFQRLHPQIALQFVPHVQGYDFQLKDLDCSILFGDGFWPGAVADYLTGCEIVLIAPPISSSAPELKYPKDISLFPLLQHVSVPQAWVRWFERHGLHGVNPLVGSQFDQFHSLICAVAVGLGVALVPRCLVEEDIRAGRVLAPFE